MRTLKLLLVAAIAFASALAAEERPFYAATFGITVGASGELVAFRLVEVIDPISGSKTPVNVHPPQTYVNAVRQLVLEKKYKPQLVNGEPKEFFTWFFYVPSQPDRADLDPTEKHK